MSIADIKKRESEEKINGIYGFVLKNSEETARLIFEAISKSNLDSGDILMVVGPERSGKSIVAIKLKKLFEKEENKRRKLIFCQPEVNRMDVPRGKIYSRVGEEIKAISFSSKNDIEKLFHEGDVVVCDEVNFIPAELQSFFLAELMLFVDRGGWFVGLALDHTSQGGEFVFPALIKLKARSVYRMTSLCQMCGGRTDKYSQRLIGGRPASVETPTLLGPSDEVTYEPRCDDCFIVKR